MSDIRGVASQKTYVPSVSDGSFVGVRCARDGSLFVLDWKLGAILEGRGFHVSVGAFSTPIVGGGDGTIADADQPEFVISVPNGTSIMPIRVSVQCHTPLLATDADESEIVLVVDNDAEWDATGTSTEGTAYNMNLGASVASVCSCESAFTANITTVPVANIELARAVRTGDMNGTPGNALWGELSLLYEPVAPFIINGPAMLVGYWGGTVATSGFAQIEWIEKSETFYA